MLKLSKMKHCPECGNKIKETSKYCPGCGYELKIFHEILKTPKKKNINLKEDEEEIFECSSCGKEFKSELACSKHIESCGEEDEKENFWECEYCGKKFKNETLCLRHEKICHNKYKEEETKSIYRNREEYRREPEYEKVVVHEHHKSSSGGVIAFFVGLLVIGVIIFFVIMIANQGGFSSGGGVSRIVDPCQSAFDSCNNGCGDGWLAGACKEKCSYDYRKCEG